MRKHLGDVVFQTKIMSSGPIAKLFYYDYRMDGTLQLIAVTSKGLI